MNEVRLRLSITPTRIEVRQFFRSGNAVRKFLCIFVRSPMGEQDIYTMENKPFESPEVKVLEIRPRSIIAQSECTTDSCPPNAVCVFEEP